MTLNAIVEQLYRDRRVNEFIRKQQPSDLQDDLLHHCISEFYRIAEKYPGKIEQLHTDNQLWAYFHGMACQQMHSTKSTFWTRFRRQSLPIDALDWDMPDDAPPGQYNALQRELYETIYDRHGKQFADYQFLEIERQESLRIANFGKEKVVKFKQPELF